jgi:hypothetical protein
VDDLARQVIAALQHIKQPNGVEEIAFLQTNLDAAKALI